MPSRTILPILLIIFMALTPVSRLSAQPTKTDYIKSFGGLIFYLSMEYGWRDNIIPEEPRFTESNSVDKYFRSQWRWHDDNLDQAGSMGDFMLYRVFIGSGFWTPLFSKSGYMPMFLTNLQVLAINGVLTNAVKALVGRQRPSAYYETWEPADDDNLSFYSGHTSFAFAMGTSAAYMLTESHPQHKTLIWATTLTLATGTGYLRIAADKHYMSDVIVGAVMGTLVGYWVPRYRQSPFMPTITPSQAPGNSGVILSWGF